MWLSGQVTIEIEVVEGSEMIVIIGTPAGTIEIVGNVTLVGGRLTIDGAHVQGLSPGALRWAGLNAIGCRILEETGASSLIIQGGIRTTGRNRGRRPSPIRFPR